MAAAKKTKSKKKKEPRGSSPLLSLTGTRGELAGVLMAVLAVAMGSRLSHDTFDIHFEKAREDIDGAYGAVNAGFAAYLRKKHPEVRFLDREDDLGLPGLRKAKLSYHPHHLMEKCWAYRKEDLDEDQ